MARPASTPTGTIVWTAGAYRSGRIWASLAVLGLIACAALAFVQTLLVADTISALTRYDVGLVGPDALMTAADSVQAANEGLLVAEILTAVPFLAWLRRSVHNTAALGFGEPD